MDQQDQKKKIIILLEDDKFLRKIYMEVLTKEGYDVHPAPEADTGIQFIKMLQWDLLLLDIMLPVKDGLEILGVIESANLKKGKIVMLTNLNNENIIKDAFLHGADGYIIKSDVTPGALINEVKTFI